MIKAARFGFATLALMMLTGCSGGLQLAAGDPYSYFDQHDMNMYYWSKNCSAALCNPR